MALRISTRGRYALQALVVLSTQPAGEPMMLKHIAAGANVSEGYLQQLFIALRAGGLVKGIKGAIPGYMLAKPAEAIAVGEVLRIMESAFTTTDCLVDDDCDQKDRCVARGIWSELKDEIDRFVDALTLAQLAEQYKKALAENAPAWGYAI
jgi:Rrf2 family protein